MIDWQARIVEVKAAGKPLRAAISDSPDWWWDDINAKTKEVLHRYLKPGDKVLDAGCGVGDLYELVPTGVDYTGIDYILDFIEEARHLHPTGKFYLVDIEHMVLVKPNNFTWIIGRGVPLLMDKEVQAKLLNYTKNLLVMSFADPSDHEVICQ